MTNSFKIALAITGGVVAVEATISKAYRLGKVKGAEEFSIYIKNKEAQERQQEEEYEDLDRTLKNIHSLN
jgi:hypothetical protein